MLERRRSQADIAQLAERLTRNEQVRGSIPRVGFLAPEQMNMIKHGLSKMIIRRGSRLVDVLGIEK
jgi:hypothetical protein